MNLRIPAYHQPTISYQLPHAVRYRCSWKISVKSFITQGFLLWSLEGPSLAPKLGSKWMCLKLEWIHPIGFICYLEHGVLNQILGCLIFQTNHIYLSVHAWYSKILCAPHIVQEFAGLGHSRAIGRTSRFQSWVYLQKVLSNALTPW